jgi:hypothetical protein
VRAPPLPNLGVSSDGTVPVEMEVQGSRVMLSTGVMMMFESYKTFREIQLPVANVVEQ